MNSPTQQVGGGKKKKKSKKPLTDAEKASRKAERDREKVKRTPYRAEDGPLLKDIPTDIDMKTQFPPKKSDFEHEATYFEFRAAESDKSAGKFREMAEEARLMGSGKERAKMKKLKKMTEDIESLSASMREDLGEEKFNELRTALLKG